MQSCMEIECPGDLLTTSARGWGWGKALTNCRVVEQKKIKTSVDRLNVF